VIPPFPVGDRLAGARCCLNRRRVPPNRIQRCRSDIGSHGIWGGIVFGRKNRFSYRFAFTIGLTPAGILWIGQLLALYLTPDFSNGTPPESSIPAYVHPLYDVTHSLVVSLVVFRGVVTMEAPGLGTRCLGIARDHGWAYPLICVLPHAGALAACRMEVQRLAMDNTRYPCSKFGGAVSALCMVSLTYVRNVDSTPSIKPENQGACW